MISQESGEWGSKGGRGSRGARILDFRFWIKELKFNPKDALYETRKERGLALSVGAASRREAMPQALRCAIVNSIIQN
ncbi:hypothetical protein [Nostoc sp.]|uniref:hypothetical protein n=1 Tax=Nostoc sp. TaxID=1180 RepID=UPI002FF638C7